MSTKAARRVSITHVNNSHSTWLRSLDFYKSELNILKGELAEIAVKNTHKDVRKEVEHYENQFKVQTENIDTLVHDIKKNVANIAAEAHDGHAGHIEGKLLAQHDNFEKKFEDEEKVINELRHNFQRFAADWM